ncbi:3-deoxy-7-phosphoheptulonate synthase [Candidatus Sumerlaeota bacterium]|nr:3-deoxy-7-phosphoheptulonate synthase [Candidatus Sumerlaeota bacterium]
MIIVMEPGSKDEYRQAVISEIEELGYQAHVIIGVERTVVACVGHEDKTPLQHIASMPGVEQVIPILKPFKLASRETKAESSVIDVGGVLIGGQELTVMAGPCSVESEEQVLTIARAVKAAGAKILRGGAFKPRTSPYSFQGMGEDGLKILATARDETGLKVVTEVVSLRELDLCLEYADMLQIGARNCQNYPLLREIGMSQRPVLFKRGMSTTIKEYLQAAEYMLSEGNYSVVLCERGIRTFEDATRFTLDLNAVPVIKSQTHLPLIVDPSHGTGVWRYVTPMAKAGVACGADGLMIEVHPKPKEAASDGPQALKPDTFTELMREVRKVAESVGRTLPGAPEE